MAFAVLGPLSWVEQSIQVPHGRHSGRKHESAKHLAQAWGHHAVDQVGQGHEDANDEDNFKN